MLEFRQSTCTVMYNYMYVQATHILRDELPGRLVALYRAMLQCRHELEEGAEVVELLTLGRRLDEKLYDLSTVHQVALLGNTPHEEQ